MIIRRLSPIQWQSMSEDAHMICFQEKRDKAMDRLDFVLLAVTVDEPVAYMTCKEHDATTVYLQTGGKLPSAMGTSGAFRAYKEMLNRLSTFGYTRAFTLIENTNRDMLRIASKVGWLISGTSTRNGKLFVEHILDL